MDQNFVLFLEVVDTIDPGRVDLQSGRFASLARIFDNDRKEKKKYLRLSDKELLTALLSVKIMDEQRYE